MFRSDREQIAFIYKLHRIGVVFQHAHLSPHMDVRCNLFYGWKRTPAEQRRITPEALIEVLNL
ncbi:MAG: hypothetical protein V2B20_00985 [Pseudomonadota bacterium]